MAKPSQAPAANAALAGLLAVAAALGAGHLVAGLMLVPGASPFFAVGNATVDHTPGPVKDFAIAHFGTGDKTALLIGMVVTLALAGIVIGLIARRRPLPGLIAIGVLGVIGILAVFEQSNSPLGILAPVTSLLVGLAAFRWLYDRARPPIAGGSAPTSETSSFERRRFLASSIGVAAAGAGAGIAGRALFQRADVAASRRAIGQLIPTVPAPPIPPDAAFPEQGTPPFITPNRDFYRIDTSLTVPQISAQNAVLRITGMVDHPVEITFDEIRAMPLVEKTITMACVSNFVGGPYVSTSNFVGVPLMGLLDRAGVQPGATQLVGHSVNGFTIGTPLEILRGVGDDALLVIGMNREPLPAEHGFPMRTVIPGYYGYVSATKWLRELELATFDVIPYWGQRGWDHLPEGIVPIKISSRIDAPRPSKTLSAGPVTAAGPAWAPGRGIDRVEVQFDDGPWQPAELAAQVSVNAWRMWRITRSLQPGFHQITVRAVDGNGVLQQEEHLGAINPGPDGSTGLHSIDVEVR